MIVQARELELDRWSVCIPRTYSSQVSQRFWWFLCFFMFSAICGLSLQEICRLILSWIVYMAKMEVTLVPHGVNRQSRSLRSFHAPSNFFPVCMATFAWSCLHFPNWRAKPIPRRGLFQESRTWAQLLAAAKKVRHARSIERLTCCRASFQGRC